MNESKIACLGWGSLTWRPEKLPLEGDWHQDGPLLPVEFARQSTGGRITLVLTPGAPELRVLWARFAVTTLDEAIAALAEREGVKEKNIRYSIGYWSPNRASTFEFPSSIGEWAQAKDLNAVVWTALRPYFQDEWITPTREQIVSHLKGLTGEAADSAREYIERAPDQIQTPIRAAVEKELKWQPRTSSRSA